MEVKPRWRGVSHEAAAFGFPVLGGILVALAHTTAARWAAAVYTVGLTAMYAASACYHRGRWNPSVRLRLRRLDHSMILVGIGARIYSARRPDPVPAVFGFHEVFHALVIAAGLIFYVAIARVIVAG